MNNANGIECNPTLLEPRGVAAARDTSMLKPKGACWYCNAPLDNIRRFCSKTCASDYQTEEEAFKPLAP